MSRDTLFDKGTIIGIERLTLEPGIHNLVVPGGFGS